MGVIGGAGATFALTGAALASASGWSSPTGLAAFLTALVGAGAFIWSVVQGMRRRRQIDIDAAVDLIEAYKKREERDEK